jgi:uncharacterized protein (TIGR03382 family)
MQARSSVARILVLGVAVSGCFYTDPIAGDGDTIFFDGICRCVICMDPAQPPGFCNGPTTIDDVPVEFCHTRFLDSNTAIAKLTRLCGETQDSLNSPIITAGPVVASCGLQPVNNSPDPVEEFVNRGTQQGVCLLEDRDKDPVGAAGGSRATLTSQISVTGPSLSAVANVTGEIEFYGGNCEIGSCPIKIAWVKLTSPSVDVTISGSTKTATDVIVSNQTVGTGTCLSFEPAFDACGFLLDPSSLQISVSGINPDNNERDVVKAHSTDSGGGIISFPDRRIALTQVFTGNGTTIDFNLSGTVDNFAPHVILAPTIDVACGHHVVVPAMIEDVDDPIQNDDVTWLVDGTRVHTGTSPLAYDFAPGIHQVDVIARDRHGGFAHEASRVTVAADTTPPQIVPNPASVCLWPPNHDESVITADDLNIIAIDECDPAPHIVFVGAASDQPDNGLGDGNTINDFVVKSDSVCVRNERQGVKPQGRTYAITAVAVDSAGNTSAPATLDIEVPHDQSPSMRCDVSAGTRVRDDDPRCIPDPNAAPAPSTSHGCQASDPTGSLAWILAALVAVRQRRFRKR